MNYEFNFVLEENEYNNLRKDVNLVKRNKQFTKDITKFSKFLLILIIALCITLSYITNFNFLSTLLSLIAMIIFLLLTYQFVNKYNLLNFKKMGFIGNHHIIFNDTGIQRNLKNSTLFYKWELIPEVKSTENYILFYTLDNKFIYIPKNVFKEKLQMHEFFNYVGKFSKYSVSDEIRTNRKYTVLIAVICLLFLILYSLKII